MNVSEFRQKNRRRAEIIRPRQTEEGFIDSAWRIGVIFITMWIVVSLLPDY